MVGKCTNRLGAHASQMLIVAVGMAMLVLGPNSVAQTKLDGDTIRMQPSGASFRIPLDWTKEYNAVTITRAQLEKEKRGRGEWYKEYAAVLNASLPFSACSVQAGTHAWDAPTFGGIQMRGYVFDSSADEVEARIARKGLTAAKGLPASTARNASVDRSELEEWHKILIAYDVWYGDYGGKAKVEFYVSAHEAKTVVLVFMYVGSESEAVIQQILKSFSWKQRPN